MKGYDYSQGGWYFVTICTHNRLPILGEIVGAGSNPNTRDETAVGAGSKPALVIDTPKVVLNENGEIVEQMLLDLVNQVSNMRLHAFVVMPNHIRRIIETVGEPIMNQSIVGAGSKPARSKPAPDCAGSKSEAGIGLVSGERAGLEPAPTDGMVGKRITVDRDG